MNLRSRKSKDGDDVDHKVIQQVTAKWVIEKFDPRTMMFEEFSDRFERRADRFINDPEEKIMLLEAALPPMVQDDLWDLLKENDDIDIENILKSLCLLHGSMDAKEVNRQLQWITQQPNESAQEFHSRWKVLERRCKRYDMVLSDNLKLQAFMSKLRDADKVELMAPESVQDAVNIARRVEKRKGNRMTVDSSHSSWNGMKINAIVHAVSLKCFNCGSDKHKSRQCFEAKDIERIKERYIEFRKENPSRTTNSVQSSTTRVDVKCSSKDKPYSSLVYADMKI